jgi:hypothetical protein
VEDFDSGEAGESFVTITKHGIKAKQYNIINNSSNFYPDDREGVYIEGVTVTIIDASVQELFFDYCLKRSEEVTQPDRYTVPLGRTLVLAPVKWFIPDGAVFEWKVITMCRVPPQSTCPLPPPRRETTR